VNPSKRRHLLRATPSIHSTKIAQKSLNRWELTPRYTNSISLDSRSFLISLKSSSSSSPSIIIPRSQFRITVASCRIESSSLTWIGAIDVQETTSLENGAPSSRFQTSSTAPCKVKSHSFALGRSSGMSNRSFHSYMPCTDLSNTPNSRTPSPLRPRK
jgi:hypothetical protein